MVSVGRYTWNKQNPPLLEGSELCRLKPLPQLPTSVVPSSVASSTASSFLTALPLPFLTKPGSGLDPVKEPLRNLPIEPWKTGVAETEAEGWCLGAETVL